MFSHSIKITLQDTDSAGVLFFANQFSLIHKAYEILCSDLGFPISKILAENEIILPIVHASSDFKAPVHLDDLIRISISLDKISNSSFTLIYKLSNEQDVEVGSAKTVHVAVGRQSKQKIDLPDYIISALQSINVIEDK